MDLNLQKPEGNNLLRKYLHTHIIYTNPQACLGICYALGGECIMQTLMKEKVSFVNMFCIKLYNILQGCR